MLARLRSYGAGAYRESCDLSKQTKGEDTEGCLMSRLEFAPPSSQVCWCSLYMHYDVGYLVDDLVLHVLQLLQSAQLTDISSASTAAACSASIGSNLAHQCRNNTGSATRYKQGSSPCFASKFGQHHGWRLQCGSRQAGQSLRWHAEQACWPLPLPVWPREQPDRLLVT